MNSVNEKIAEDYWLRKVNDFGITQSYIEADEPQEHKIILAQSETGFLKKITRHNVLAEYTVFYSLFQFLLQRYFKGVRLVHSSGSDFMNSAMLFSIIEPNDVDFKTYLNLVKTEIEEVLKYDSIIISNIDKNLFRQYTSFGFYYQTTSFVHGFTPFSFVIRKSKKGDYKISLFYTKEIITEELANHFLSSYKRLFTEIENLVVKKMSYFRTVSEAEKEFLLYQLNPKKRY
jgi:hypothetical protein